MICLDWYEHGVDSSVDRLIENKIIRGKGYEKMVQMLVKIEKTIDGDEI
jgi:hypothetical protein